MFYSISVDRTHDVPLLHVPFKRKKKQSSHIRELSVGVSELLCPNHNFLLREGFCCALLSSTLHIFFFTNKQLKKSAKNYHDRHALNPCSNRTIFFSTWNFFFLKIVHKSVRTCMSYSSIYWWINEEVVIPVPITTCCFRVRYWCMERPPTWRLPRMDAPSPWEPLTDGSCCLAWYWNSAILMSSWSNTSLPVTLPHPPLSAVMMMDWSPKREGSSWTKMHKSFMEQLRSCWGCLPRFAPMFRWRAGGSQASAASQTRWWWPRSSSKLDPKPAASSDLKI